MAKVALTRYIKELNVWRTPLYKQPAYDVNNLSHDDVVSIRSSAEYALSPENLSQDGEASVTFVQSRGKFLHQVLHELNEIN